MTPSVSVIVPARDAAATLPALFSGLDGQGSPDFEHEVIVVDSGSSDDTAEVARRAGARVIRHEVPGASAARNAGARAAQGSLLVFLDADCIPQPGWLERLVAAMGDEEVGGVGGTVTPAPPRTLTERWAADRGDVTQDRGLRDPFAPWVLTANCCYRREVFDGVGGFEESMRGGEDVHLAWQMQLTLGRQMGFAEAAVVLHQHRSTLTGLWHQWVRNGWTSVHLRTLYPEAAAATVHQGRPVSAWALRRLRELVGALSGLPSGRTDALDVARPFLDTFAALADRVGRRQARRVLQGH